MDRQHAPPRTRRFRRPLLIAIAALSATAVAGTLGAALLTMAARDSFINLHERHRDEMCACVEEPAYEANHCVELAWVRFVDDRYNATPTRYREPDSTDVDSFLYTFSDAQRAQLAIVESAIHTCADHVARKSPRPDPRSVRTRQRLQRDVEAEMRKLGLGEPDDSSPR